MNGGRSIEAVWGGAPIVLMVAVVISGLLLWRLPGCRTPSRVPLVLATAGWSGSVVAVIGLAGWNPALWSAHGNPWAVRPWSVVPLGPLWRVLGGTPITIGMWEQMGGNLLLLAPLGILLPLLTGRRPRVVRVALLAAAASAGLELLQLAGRFGIADVDDVLLNVTGVVLAYGALRLVEVSRRSSGPWRPSRRRTP